MARRGSLALEPLRRAASAAPHALRHAQRVLEQLEALAEWRKREAEPLRLVLVPRRTDAEPGASTTQHVQRGGCLDPEAGRAVVDPADHEAEACALGVRGEKSERRP